MKYCDGHFGGSPKTVLVELMVSLCLEKEMALKICHLPGSYTAFIQDRTECCFEKLVVFCLRLGFQSHFIATNYDDDDYDDDDDDDDDDVDEVDDDDDDDDDYDELKRLFFSGRSRRVTSTKSFN